MLIGGRLRGRPRLSLKLNLNVCLLKLWLLRLALRKSLGRFCNLVVENKELRRGRAGAGGRLRLWLRLRGRT